MRWVKSVVFHSSYFSRLCLPFDQFQNFAQSAHARAGENGKDGKSLIGLIALIWVLLPPLEIIRNLSHLHDNCSAKLRKSGK
jgi:hypothetical protein